MYDVCYPSALDRRLVPYTQDDFYDPPFGVALCKICVHQQPQCHLQSESWYVQIHNINVTSFRR